MQKTLLYPQEIEVYYLIPSIRGAFARYLKQQGFNQKKIAKLLMIQESTVSQYAHAKRAAKITFPQNIEKELEKSALLLKSSVDVIRETQRLLTLIRLSGTICQIHKQVTPFNLPCNPQETGCAPRVTV